MREEKDTVLTIADGARQAKIFVGAEEFSGVKKIARKVLNDLWLVTDRKYELAEGTPGEQSL